MSRWRRNPGAIERQAQQKRSLYIWALKLVGTIALLAWIAQQTDWEQLWHIVRNCNVWLLSAVVVLRFVGVWMTSYKWQKVLAIHGLRYGRSQLQYWYLASLFLNHVLPTSIGGDTYRIYKTWTNKRGRSCAILAVLVERVLGFAALLLLGYFAAMFLFAQREDFLSGTILLSGTVLLLGIALSGLFFGRSVLPTLCSSRRLPARLQSALAHLGDFRRHPADLMRASAMATAFQLNRIFVFWITLLALGVQEDFFALTVAVVLATMVSVLPISLGGLVLFDGVCMYVLMWYGMQGETALAANVLVRLLLLPVILTGAYCYLRGDRVTQPSRSMEMAVVN